MIKDFYQQELNNLRELGVEFARDNPALAPMLGARGDDPDVERLLEGVAFLSAMVRARLSDGLPDMVEALLRLLCPELILATPSSTIMHFKPAQGFGEAFVLPAGSQLASVPIDSTRARFSTSADLIVNPASVVKVEIDPASGASAAVSLTISSAAPLNRWLQDSLIFHLAGDYPEASERRRLILQRSVKVSVEVRGRTLTLNQAAVTPAGFEAENFALSLNPSLSLALLRDYFAMPQKFLFLKLSGLKPLAASTENELTVRFFLDDLKSFFPPSRAEHFLLNACPAVNLFPYPGRPLIVDHKRSEYLIRPQDYDAEKLDIHRVSNVSSITADGKTKIYRPFERLGRPNPDIGLYTISRRASPVSGKLEHYLQLIYKNNQSFSSRESLSIDLICHNAGLTNVIRTGEISQSTDTSPAMASFSNILPATKHSAPVLNDEQMWSLLSHLNVNLMARLTADSLREILTLHAVPNDADIGRRLSNLKRIEALEKATAVMEDLFILGRPYRGTSIELTVDPRGFASKGDLYLFGDALDSFFGICHHLNTYSRLSIIETHSREIYSWPPRLGLKRLI
ncbi:MAG: type VI secretion system baseplate subunit TssF [Deltaproteobacteria bacterium]|nr:type VI secretion system baseplate subunit TssF [Deltaproteobacteria bacterium]